MKKNSLLVGLPINYFKKIILVKRKKNIRCSEYVRSRLVRWDEKVEVICSRKVSYCELDR